MEMKCREPNSEYTECGAFCQPTCMNPRPKNCITVCIEGCVCRKGFLRDNRRRCVPEGKCPR